MQPRWLDQLEERFSDLAEAPRMYPELREEWAKGKDIRAFVHHSHRVVYRVLENSHEVEVLRIYHGSRDDLKTTDI